MMTKLSSEKGLNMKLLPKIFFETRTLINSSDENPFSK